MDASDKDDGQVQSVLTLGQHADNASSGAVTPCILAAAAANDVHAKYLVHKGARRDVLLPGNFTLFHIAADLNLVGTLAALLDEADSQQDSHIITTCLAIQTTEKQCTPLDLAVIEGHLRCVMLLLGEPEEQVGPSVGPAPRIPFLSSLVRIK